MSCAKPCVITIGKFESMHQGHRKLIERVVNCAKDLDIMSAAIVFDPLPYQYFAGDEYKVLFTKNERMRLLQGVTGLDNLHVVPFDKKIVTLTPQEFCHMLFRKYMALHVVVGEDFYFGHGRTGTIELLALEAAKYNATVEVTPVSAMPTAQGCSAISTSSIRSLLLQNKLQEANNMLGFPYFIEGTAQEGRQLGSKLGFPTLNIYPCNAKFLLPNGVYKTRTTFKDKVYNSITNIGTRPTVSNEQKISVETHMSAYTGGNLYGTFANVEFLHAIRPERRFNSINELKDQIKLDMKFITHKEETT